MLKGWLIYTFSFNPYEILPYLQENLWRYLLIDAIVLFGWLDGAAYLLLYTNCDFAKWSALILFGVLALASLKKVSLFQYLSAHHKRNYYD